MQIPQYLLKELQQIIMLNDEQTQKINGWIDQLLLWQKKVNLIAPSTIDDLWTRHVLDSLQLMKYFPENTKGTYVDFGSGAGFPGLAVSLFWQGECHLVDSDQKKSIFLKEVVRLWHETERIKIHNIRIDKLELDDECQLITARALASLKDLLPMLYPFINDQTMILLPKGKSWKDEIQQAQEQWSFTWVNHPSITDKNATILQITDVKEKTI